MALLVDVTGETIRIEPGEHVIGRGPLLKIKDKRVSRNHGILKVEKGTVHLCSKHKNPCFYKPATASSFTPLKEDTWVELSPSDQFSLLPNHLIFTVRIQSQDTTASLDVAPVMQPADNDPGCQTDTAVNKASSSHDSDQPEPAVLTVDADQTPAMGTLTSETSVVSSGKTRKLPSWLLSSTRGSKSQLPPMTTSSNYAVARRRKSETPEADMITDVPTKKAENIPVVTAAAKESDSNTMSAGSSAGTVSKKDNKLPVCPYGASCYRKNPAHIREYSHDSSPTDNDDDKPECPYGNECYRKNPLHRQQFKHTAPPAPAPAAGSKRPRRSTRKNKKNKKSALVGDSDDDGEANTYDYNDSFVDDDELSESSTSYGPDTEEDEDWTPLDESEDVTDLVSEAKSFMSNKKMHKT